MHFFRLDGARQTAAACKAAAAGVGGSTGLCTVRGRAANAARDRFTPPLPPPRRARRILHATAPPPPSPQRQLRALHLHGSGAERAARAGADVHAGAAGVSGGLGWGACRGCGWGSHAISHLSRTPHIKPSHAALHAVRRPAACAPSPLASRPSTPWTWTSSASEQTQVGRALQQAARAAHAPLHIIAQHRAPPCCAALRDAWRRLAVNAARKRALRLS